VLSVTSHLAQRGASGYGARVLRERQMLSPSFLTLWGGPAPDAVDLLERALVDLHEGGRARFPEVPLDATELAAYAGARARTDVAAHEAVAELWAADLYLACACARGIPAALRAFDAAMLAKIPAYLRRLRVSPAIEQETRAALLEKLFVSGEGAPAKILQYSGRGALEGWVRVAAVRAAMNLLEAQGTERPVGDEDAAIAGAVGTGDDPELLFLKASYRDPFVAAFREALAALPARERTLLRFAHVDGLTPERIAKLHGVHRTTAMRWLEAARAAVLEGTRARVVERLRLSPSECDGLFNLVRSRIDFSLRSLLSPDA
jgi:RNA polymerase sigma-70 factor (ECF subfamily)